MGPVGTAARTRGAQQYHAVGAAAVQPGAQSGRADLALSAQSLARQLGVFQPSGHHGGLRDGLEQVCQQPRPGPLALRGRLGFASARFVGLPVIEPWSAIESTLRSGNFRRSVLVRPKSALGQTETCLTTEAWSA